MMEVKVQTIRPDDAMMGCCLLITIEVHRSASLDASHAPAIRRCQVYGLPPAIRGQVAYVPQSPFIISGTLRDNILFGRPYDAGRYERCLGAPCLDADLRALPGGDATELGDNGVNLSGGQRQCLSIARALYSRADVFLLDDPLSALDSKVGSRVFERAVR